jgi:hypothetical protein
MLAEFCFTRLYATEDGESRFADASVALDEGLEAPPAQPQAMGMLGDATATFVVHGDRNWGGGVPHPAPARLLFTVLRGGYEVTTSEGTSRTFGPCDVLLVEDTNGRGHTTRSLADDSVAQVTRLA